MNFDCLYGDYCERVSTLGVKRTENALVASIKDQLIVRFHNGKSVKDYPMSSSKRPPSCKENSLGTPNGLHVVCEKIGEGEPLGMVFKGRKPIGLKYKECSEEEREKNLITTRILRLQGLEDGLNKGEGIDTYGRYVYIHGTNHEENLGSPASSGCLQVSNAEAVELHDEIPLGSHLYIKL
ncbi:MAG: L,D-transpeptidase [Verrucomicrobia bacterium TMED40]|nr:MAG: L,D-transpeptidase [Verrucomicrobia bacterium TMED40]|tara:strand:+ start:2148 stop:2690 length:543 start_codon:yes stop_codon:yes gene_type:complete